MVEKYRGILPPGSVWYSLTKEEAIVLLQHKGEWEKMTPEKKSIFNCVEIYAEKGKTVELERILTNAGLTVTPLY